MYLVWGCLGKLLKCLHCGINTIVASETTVLHTLNLTVAVYRSSTGLLCVCVCVCVDVRHVLSTPRRPPPSDKYWVLAVGTGAVYRDCCRSYG